MGRFVHRLTSLLIATFLIPFIPTNHADETVLLNASVHLGTPGFPEWSHFENSTPHGRQLDLKFQSTRNASEATLYVRQNDVKYPWAVKLNGKSVGSLQNMEVELISHFTIPTGLLRDGENLLSIIPPKSTDDIRVGEIVLDSRSFPAIAQRTSIDVSVADANGSKSSPIPCRITIADEKGALAPIYTNPDETLPTGRGVIETRPRQRLAVRTGVIYTTDGRASFGLRPGRYTVYASRGFEYSVATNRVMLADGDSYDLNMQIKREVPTKGWIAADCHIHNLTYSGHGDATIDEGMVTIAGEGIEFAVATDHNHHTDYTETVKKLRLNKHFTPVVGNEVTTKTGHFNAFPILSGSSLPDHKLSDWTALMKSIRDQTGAKVIVLNHPRNVHSGFSPVDPKHFRQATGENLRGAPFSFEAMEIVTSAALQSDPMDLIRDWFGLLNFGRRITGVGSSDTHYVSRMILGQGRSYVMLQKQDPFHATTRIQPSLDPANLNIADIVKGYREGRVAVSMGLLPHISVTGEYRSGDLVPKVENHATVQVTVLGPTWIQGTKQDPVVTRIYRNGSLIETRKARLRDAPGTTPHLTYLGNAQPGVVKDSIHLELLSDKLPQHDFWLVSVSTAPGVTAPFWAIPRPYQPSSKQWTPRVIGVTNPVYFDGDGDGQYTAPRGYAKTLIAKHRDNVPALLDDLKNYDEAIAAQTASLLFAKGVDLDSESLQEELRSAPPDTRKGFQSVLQSIR